MTPKEKAEELVLKYLRANYDAKEWFHKGIAKECALIAVDELVEATEPLLSIHYWEEVRQEIKNL